MTAAAIVVFGAIAAAPASAQDRLFTADRYADLEQVTSPQISSDGNHIVFTRSSADRTSDSWVPTLWGMEADGSHQRPLTPGGGARWSPDGTRIAYFAAVKSTTQLWIRYMDAEGAAIQITHGEQAPRSFSWAPDSKSLAFAMQVADSVSRNTSPPKSRVQLFVVSSEGGAARQVTPATFRLGAGLDWLSDGKTIVAAGTDGTPADEGSNLYAIDVQAGSVRRLTSDSGYWRKPVVSPDGKWIAYTGFAGSQAQYHASDLYVMRPDGSGSRPLTGGLDRDVADVMWSDNETLWFTAEDHGTVNTWTASAALNAKPPLYKPASNGTHVLALGSISIKSGVGVVTRTAPQQPAEVMRFTVKKPWDLQPLTHINDAALAGMRLGEVEQVEFPTGGDTKIQGWLVKPPGFDPSHKYPLVLAITDDPHKMSSVAFNPELQNLAAAGFIALYMNQRGSTGYGTAFGIASDGAHPDIDFDDLMAGVNDAIGRGSIDTTRMFVAAVDNGGMLAAWTIGHTTRFAAAAIRDPVVDWISYPGQLKPTLATTFFARPFWDDPAPWLKLSPIMYAGSMKTPTLIMVSDGDMSQSLEFSAALNVRGIPASLVQGSDFTPLSWARRQGRLIDWFGKYGAVKP